MATTYIAAAAAKPVGVSKTTVYIGPAGLLPATVTTWTELGSLLSLPPVGATDALIAQDVINGPKIKLKGATDQGGGPLELSADFSDAGQTALKAAYLDKTNDYPFRYILPNAVTATGLGTLIDITAKVMMDPFDFGSGPNNPLKLKSELQVTAAPIITNAT